VKFPLNKVRGHGITVLGAIGVLLPKGVFSLARSTNKEAVMLFLHKLRSVVTPNPMGVREKIVMVLDNHSSHKT
jgi:hypothetical protein